MLGGFLLVPTHADASGCLFVLRLDTRIAVATCVVFVTGPDGIPGRSMEQGLAKVVSLRALS